MIATNSVWRKRRALAQNNFKITNVASIDSIIGDGIITSVVAIEISAVRHRPKVEFDVMGTIVRHSRIRACA